LGGGTDADHARAYLPSTGAAVGGRKNRPSLSGLDCWAELFKSGPNMQQLQSGIQKMEKTGCAEVNEQCHGQKHQK